MSQDCLNQKQKKKLHNILNLIMAHKAWEINPQNRPEPNVLKIFRSYDEVVKFIGKFKKFENCKIRYKNKTIEVFTILGLLDNLAKRQFILDIENKIKLDPDEFKEMENLNKIIHQINPKDLHKKLEV